MIAVYSKPFGKLMRHHADTDDPVAAASAVAMRFNQIEGLTGNTSHMVNMRLSATRWSLGPFLAVVSRQAA